MNSFEKALRMTGPTGNRTPGRQRRLSGPLLGAVLFLGAAGAMTAATFVVTKTADTNDGACAPTNCSLRDAIIAANASPGADVITLPAGTYVLTIAGANEDSGATGDLDILDDVTINGAGAANTIVDGGALDRVFQVFNGVTAVLTGITIQNGAGAAQGGGIFSGGTLTLNDCVVTGNQVTGQGGGIFGTDVTINNSTVSVNDAGGQGAGIFADNLTMTNSTVGGNRIPFGRGGGIYVNATTNISNCNISSNASGDLGGGIYVAGGKFPQTVNITNTTIANNTALDDGGGQGGGIYIQSIATVTVTGCTINGNSTDTDGGGIANFATLNLINSTVSGNSAFNGGGIFNAGNGNVTVTSCTLSSNNPDGLNNATAATLAKTIVANNMTDACTGPITDGGSNLQFPGSTCGSAIPTADPLLAALANNGGPTQTQALSAGSPALNAALNCPPPATDQRGVSRPQGTGCEIGAFECRGGECGSVCPIITLSPTTLPGGTLGTPYSQQIMASPAGTYTFALTAGALPAGLTLTSVGLLSGTPTASGTFNFTVTATDASSCTGSQSYTVTISTVTCVAPAAPVLTVKPTAANIGSRVTLTWTGTLPAGQGNYIVQDALNAGAYSTIATVASSGASKETLAFSLPATGGVYSFRVQAAPTCNPRLAATSNTVQVVASAPCPNAPPVTGVVVTPASAAAGDPFTLTWDAPSGFVGGFNILISTDGGQNFGLFGSSTTTSFSGVVAGDPGTVLTFEVEEAGCIYAQRSNFATLTVVPSSPSCQPPGPVSGISIHALGVAPPRAPSPTEFIGVEWNGPITQPAPTGYLVRLNGDTPISVASNSAVLPPRGTDLDPIQAFVTAVACNPAVSGPETSSDPVALFLTPPAASFTVSGNPRAGEPVLFTDTSVPQATSWLWVFDDGGKETSQSPSHTFATAGPHDVTLVATNSAGSSAATQTLTLGSAASRIATVQTQVPIDASDPPRRRARVVIPGPDAVRLTIRSGFSRQTETVVFARFLSLDGTLLVERRLAVGPGQESVYDLGAYGPRGPIVLELVSGQAYEAELWSAGHAGAREIER